MAQWQIHSHFLILSLFCFTLDIPLQHFSYLHPLFPYLSHSLASMLLLSLSAICSLYARYLFGPIPNIYRTSTGHLPNMNRSYSLALSLLHWGYLLVLLEMFFRLILNIL